MRAVAAAVGEGRLEALSIARQVNDAVAEQDVEGGLHAFLAHDPELLLARAAALDDELAGERRAGRSPAPLAGVVVGLKDNLCTLDHPTTCGSRLLEGYRSPYEATVVRRLRRAGALIAGKTNMDEFAMGSSTEASAFGPTRNPHDPGRVPGGSSGGSAAAVAAGLVHGALGSDTAGSVRQPAALCGVVGLKPTYGAVSRYGLVAFASSLDQVGTLGRTVRDAAMLLEAVAGADRLDATCARRPAPSLDGALEAEVEGLVVGVPQEYFPETLHPGVRRATEVALEALAGTGAQIRPVSLPNTLHAIPTYYVIGPAEAASNLARFDGVRFGARHNGASLEAMYRTTRSRGFGEEVKRRILLGTHLLSAGEHYHARAQRVRAAIAADFDRVFGDGVDLLFTPTTSGPAFRFGERTADPYRMYLADVFTVPANLAGIPAITVPIGFADGLPVGGQLMAPRWGEPTMIAGASALERALGSGDP